jgi:hypothetical protein
MSLRAYSRPAGLTIHVHDAPPVAQEERIGGVIHEGAETPLAGAQFRLGAEVDVLHRAEDPRGTPAALRDVAPAVTTGTNVGVNDAGTDVVSAPPRSASARAPAAGGPR